MKPPTTPERRLPTPPPWAEAGVNRAPRGVLAGFPCSRHHTAAAELCYGGPGSAAGLAAALLDQETSEMPCNSETCSTSLAEVAIANFHS